MGRPSVSPLFTPLLILPSTVHAERDLTTPFIGCNLLPHFMSLNSLFSVSAASMSWASPVFFWRKPDFFSLLSHSKVYLDFHFLLSGKSVIILPIAFWVAKISCNLLSIEISLPNPIVPVYYSLNILFIKSLVWFAHMITNFLAQYFLCTSLHHSL